MYTEKSTLRETVDRGISLIPIYAYRHHWKDYTLYLHWHNEFELIYVEKGSVVYTIDTVPIKVTEGQCIIINAGQLHTANTINNELCIHRALLFDLNFLKSSNWDPCQVSIINPLLNGNLKFPLKIDAASDWGRNVIEEVTKALEIYEGKYIGWEIGIKASLYKILFYIAKEEKFTRLENNLRATLNNKIDIIKSTINYIQNNYSGKIYIDNLAKEVNMNPQYFCRFFKANTGKTPIDFINQFRIEEAAKLIRLDNNKISEIYFEVGFDNFSYFIKKFKEYKNCTPSEYKKDYQLSNEFDFYYKQS